MSDETKATTVTAADAAGSGGAGSGIPSNAAQADIGALLLSNASHLHAGVLRGHLIIVSRQPGLRRAAHVHPGVAVYPIGRFSPGAMAQLRAEPLLEVIEIL